MLTVAASSAAFISVMFLSQSPLRFLSWLALFLLRSQPSNNKDFPSTPVDLIDDRFS